MPKLNFLHLTDAHMGSPEHPKSWSALKDEFFKDLKDIVSKSGAIELVFFTGDLTNRGSDAEFADFDKKLWEPLKDELETLNVSLYNRQGPVLLAAVPGNHDLKRPGDGLAWRKLLNGWNNFNPDSKGVPENRVVRELFFGEPSTRDSELQEAIASYQSVKDGLQAAFAGYEKWCSGWQSRLGCESVLGRMPGDFLFPYESDEGLSLLTVGLNSAYLQLSNGNFFQQLSLDARQLNALCAGEPAALIRRHHVALLLTHHPPDWLHKNDQQDFLHSIHKPDWFHAHLYGHRHLPISRTHSQGGSVPRIEWQGASLFGTETFENTSADGRPPPERIFGYSVGSIVIEEDAGQLIQYPRRAVHKQSGRMGFGPDSSFELIQDRYVIERFRPHRTVPVKAAGVRMVSRDATEPITPTSGDSASGMSAGHLDALEQSGGSRTAGNQPGDVDVDFEFALAADAAEHPASPGWEPALERLDRELCGQRLSGVVWLSDSPGTGKSALVTSFWRRHKLNDDLTVVFCNLSRPGMQTAEAIDLVIARQLQRLVPEGVGLGIEALLGLSAQRLRLPVQRVIVIYDGLDRLDDVAVMKRLLPPLLPDGILILAALRPRFPHQHILSQRIDGESIDLYSSASQVCDALLSPLELGFQYHPEAVSFCRGNLLIARHLIRHLSGQPAYGRQVPSELRSLHGVFEEHWLQLRLLPEERSATAIFGLSLLCVPDHGLHIDLLAQLAGWSDAGQKDRFLEDVGPWLAHSRIVQPYHPLFRKFIRAKLGTATTRQLLLRFADFFGRWPLEAEEEVKEHALFNAINYLLATGPTRACLEKALALVTNVEFLEQQMPRMGAESVAEKLEALAVHAEPLRSRMLQDIAGVIRKEAPLLDSVPQGLPGLLYSRLIGGGWTPEQILGRLRFSDGRPLLRLRMPLAKANQAVERVFQSPVRYDLGRIAACSEKWFWAVSGDGLFSKWRVDRGEQDRVGKLATFPTALAAAWGGSLALCGGTVQGRGEVWLLTSKKGDWAVKLGHHEGPITGIAISTDWALGASLAGDGQCKIWDLQLHREIPAPSPQTPARTITCCALSDSGWFIQGTRAGELVVTQLKRKWHSANRERLIQHVEHQTYILRDDEAGPDHIPTCCTVARSTALMACGFAEGVVELWDLPTQSLRRTLRLPTEATPRSCSLSASGELLVLQSDLGLHAWDTELGEMLWCWPTQTLRDFTVVGDRLVTVDGGPSLEVWQPTTDVPHGAGDFDLNLVHLQEITACVLTAGAETALSCAWHERNPLLWQLRSEPQRRRAAQLPSFRSGCRVGASRLVLAREDEPLVVVQTSDWSVTHHLSVMGLKVASSADQCWMLVVQRQGIEVWAVDRLLAGAKEPDYRCTTAELGDASAILWYGAVTSSTHLAAISDSDGNLRLLDWSSARRRPLDLSWRGASSCAFSPSGRLFAAGNEQGEIEIWNISRWPRAFATKQRLLGHTQRVNGLVFPNDQELISAGGDATIRRWRLSDGVCTEVFCGAAPFFQIDYLNGVLCAGDRHGQVWFVDVPAEQTAPTMTNHASTTESWMSGIKALWDRLRAPLKMA